MWKGQTEDPVLYNGLGVHFQPGVVKLLSFAFSWKNKILYCRKQGGIGKLENPQTAGKLLPIHLYYGKGYEQCLINSNRNLLYKKKKKNQTDVMNFDNAES